MLSLALSRRLSLTHEAVIPYPLVLSCGLQAARVTGLAVALEAQQH